MNKLLALIARARLILIAEEIRQTHWRPSCKSK